MACQPAAQRALFFLMALDAKSHLKTYSANSVHGFNVSMALDTVYSFSNMPLVFKKDMLRKKIRLFPGNRCLCVKIPVFLLYFRMIDDDILMTVQTLFHRRYSRKRGPLHIRMAEPALDLFYTGMHLVAEGNRLLGPETGFRKHIKQIQEAPCEAYTTPDDNQGPFIPNYCVYHVREKQIN